MYFLEIHCKKTEKKGQPIVWSGKKTRSFTVNSNMQWPLFYIMNADSEWLHYRLPKHAHQESISTHLLNYNRDRTSIPADWWCDWERFEAVAM